MLLENKKKYISYNNNITFKSGLNIFFEYLIEKNKQQKYPNFEIIYGEHNTKFGKCFLAVINNNICSLVFNFNNINDYKNYLQNEWKEAILKQNKETIKAIVLDVFEKQKKSHKIICKRY